MFLYGVAGMLSALECMLACLVRFATGAIGLLILSILQSAGCPLIHTFQRVHVETVCCVQLPFPQKPPSILGRDPDLLSSGTMGRHS